MYGLAVLALAASVAGLILLATFALIQAIEQDERDKQWSARSIQDRLADLSRLR